MYGNEDANNYGKVMFESDQKMRIQPCIGQGERTEVPGVMKRSGRWSKVTVGASAQADFREEVGVKIDI